MKLKEYMSAKKLTEEANKVRIIKISKKGYGRRKYVNSKKQRKNHDNDSQRN